MSKDINKTNTHLEEALSDFISKISEDPNKNTDLIAKKFLTQLEKNLIFQKKILLLFFPIWRVSTTITLFTLTKFHLLAFVNTTCFHFLGK